MGYLSKVWGNKDWSLQLLIMNDEFPVSVSNQLILITSLPLVHTAHCYYWLNGLVRSSDWHYHSFIDRIDAKKKVDQTWSFRGSNSCNKVSIEEPAEWSLLFVNMTKTHCEQYQAHGIRVYSFNNRPHVSSHLKYFNTLFTVFQ